MNFRQSRLFQSKCLVNGKWIEGKSTLPVLNPFDDSVINHIPLLGQKECLVAIDAAYSAFEVWSQASPSTRSKTLRRWAELIDENAEELAEIMRLEQGKTLKQALAEIEYGSSFIYWFADEALRIFGDLMPSETPGEHGLVLKEPVGVVGAITPWNFPSSMITRKCAPALAVGCTLVIKPDEQTPLSAFALGVLAQEAGFPDGVINFITGDAKAIGQEMMDNAKVRKLSFTGSTEVGKILMRGAANHVKKLSLELGGNAPFIVFEDANLDLTVKKLIAAKFRNWGQSCICPNRIYVHESIQKVFVEKVKKAIEELEKGVFPLINQAALGKVERLIHEAEQAGARVISGAKRSGNSFDPTIVIDVKDEMSIAQEEIFGPVISCLTFSDERDVIERANATRYGLASYIFTENLHRAWRVPKGLEYGMVGVNEVGIASAGTPFGGHKESGIGVEGSRYGVNDYLEMKYVCMGAPDETTT
ncbi:MAG: NAD-dependent succinate-semialdehyde dehydrogenase [Simkaniaceae bacterium]|nr:NAD-dependent succinate-semialdehyde dehydrogenase [Simkaniaceae bacterium]